jgi:serine/threonine-protein kinase
MSVPIADRNLLCAVLALRERLISRDQFIEVCTEWTERRPIAMSELLVNHGWIGRDLRGALEAKLDRGIAGLPDTASKTRVVPEQTLVRPAEEGPVGGTLVAPSATGLDHGPHTTQADPPDGPGETLVREVLPETQPGLAAGTHDLQTTLAGLPTGADFVRVGELGAQFRPSAQSTRYTLTRVHGEGALGKVWLARDSDLNREVALKEIRSDHAANPHTIRRFVREAQVTGQLQHPNIVPVYELARRRQDDQPFYTMKLVQGRTLLGLIAAYHRPQVQAPPDQLDLQKLLSAFVAVCQAIGYAHSRGVVHRDLKPENIVVGDFEEVIVLDWGIAKLVNQPDDAGDLPPVKVSGEGSATATRGVLGTPAYMAPEQADARQDLIDARTDIYGLGAILFDILTGQPPHDGTSLTDLIMRIRMHATPRARRVNPSVPPALDAICAKAMAKERAERYAKATDLAEDVRRWMADEPVSAYRDPFPTRALRWARRHKTGVTAAAVLLATTLIGLSAGILAVDRERRKTDQERKLAVAYLGIASGAAEDMLSKVGDVDLAEVPQMELVRKDLLERARGSYARLLEQRLSQDPRMRGLHARALVRLADVETLLNHSRAAEATYGRALGELNRLVHQFPKDAAFQRDLARAYHGQALVLKQEDQFRRSEESFRTAIRLHERLVAQSPRDPDSRQALLESRYHLAALLARSSRRRDQREAETYQQAIADQRTLVREDKGRPERQIQLGRYRNNLGILLKRLDDLDGAAKEFEEAIALEDLIVQKAPSLSGARWMRARSSGNAGTVLLELARKASIQDEVVRLRSVAVGRFEGAMNDLDALVAEYPSIPQYKQELARICSDLGELFDRARNPAEAAKFYQRVAALTGELATRYPDVPEYRYKHADAQFRQAALQLEADPKVARAARRAALAKQRALVQDHPDVIEYADSYYENLAREAGLLSTRAPAEARRDAEEALAYHRKDLASRPEDPSARLAVREDTAVLALALIGLGDYDAAARAAEELVRLMPEDRQSYLGAAYLLGNGLGAIARDARLDAAQRDQLAAKLGDRTMPILREAVRRGFIKTKGPLNDRRLEPLKSRGDFQRLRDSLPRPATDPVVG